MAKEQQNLTSFRQPQESNDVQTEVMDQIDFSDNFMFGNPISFIDFLTEVINQTIIAKEANKRIDIHQIISESAGKRMGIAIDNEQLKTMA